MFPRSSCRGERRCCEPRLLSGLRERLFFSESAIPQCCRWVGELDQPCLRTIAPTGLCHQRQPEMRQKATSGRRFGSSARRTRPHCVVLRAYPSFLRTLIVPLTTFATQAARQKHEEIVSVLLSAGANLGGADEGVALSLLHSAVSVGDEDAIALWDQVGVKTSAA